MKHHYERFFERQTFLNRQRLMEWIDQYEPPFHEEEGFLGYKFNIDGYTIHVNHDDRMAIFKGHECIMSGWIGDTSGRKTNEYVASRFMYWVDERQDKVEQGEVPDQDYFERIGMG
jgi:hypothetical protein